MPKKHYHPERKPTEKWKHSRFDSAVQTGRGGIWKRRYGVSAFPDEN